MPEGECPEIYFIHHNRFIKVPFVVYADFEAFTEEISTCEPNQEFSFTQQYQKHKLSGFYFKIVLMKNYSIKNQFSTEQRVKMKISVKNSWRCLKKKSRRFIKNSTFLQR